MDKRWDRGQATRQHMVGTATRLFAADGYEAVSIEAVLKACGVSRGALYHHFSSKKALFTAVLETAEARVCEQVRQAAQGASSPIEGLRAGCAAWLALAADDQTVRQIVLTDAPAVLGWQAWRAIDGEHSLGLIRGAFTLAAATGRVQADRLDLYAQLLLAALIEVALMIARAPDDGALRLAGTDAVERVLGALFAVDQPLTASPALTGPGAG